MFQYKYKLTAPDANDNHANRIQKRKKDSGSEDLLPVGKKGGGAGVGSEWNYVIGIMPTTKLTFYLYLFFERQGCEDDFSLYISLHYLCL